MSFESSLTLEHGRQVILEEACSQPVLTTGPGGLVVGGADAVVREPALLVLLVQASRYFRDDEVCLSFC